MNKLICMASIVLLGTALGAAQCSSATQPSSATVAPATVDTRTPSAIDPQTSSPDSINRFNPVTGQNVDSQRNPNAVSRSEASTASTAKTKPSPTSTQPAMPVDDPDDTAEAQ